MNVSGDFLKNIINQLVKEIEPVQVFLFGSYAWGMPEKGSDLDFMIIVPEGRGAIRELKQRARKCLRNITIPIDLIIEPVSLFESRKQVHASLESMVAEQGKKLYG